MEKNSNNVVSEEAVQSNLTQESSSNDWADPAKNGFHKTNAGWTTDQPDQNYTSVAKKAHTTLIDTNTGKELSKDNRLEVSQGSSFGFDINATVDKNDIKQGNRVLLSSVAVLDPDGRHFAFNFNYSLYTINVISNGVKIGHLTTTSNNLNVLNKTMTLNVYLAIDQTQNMAQDLNLHFKVPKAVDIDVWSAYYQGLAGTTKDNPATTRVIANDSDSYNYTLYVDPNKATKPSSHWNDYNSVATTKGLNQYLNRGEVTIGRITHDPDKAFISQGYTLNRVYKITRPKSIAGADIPNFKSQTFWPTLHINDFTPIVTKDGYLGNTWQHSTFIGSNRLADGLSVQQVAEAAKQSPLVFSISDDGQSMLVGVNISLDRTNLVKYDPVLTVDNLVNVAKGTIAATRGVNIDYVDQKQDIITRSTDWVKAHNGEADLIDLSIENLPYDLINPIVQTVSDVTLGVKNPTTKTDTYVPKNSDLHFDVSVYRNISVKYIDDDATDPAKKILNTDMFQTTTGTDLTYNIKLATDPTFDSSKDIAFPNNFVLNQPATIHYGIVQDKNQDIEIHVKHLVKTVDGSTNLDLYPQIKNALNGDSTRTFHITYPAGRQGSNPSTIVQSIHFIRSGKADFSTDSVTPSTLTAWTPVASTAKGVTITNGVARFDSITLPCVAGYTAEIKQNPQNKMMYLVSFVANPVPNVPKADDNKTTVAQGSITIDNKSQDKIHDNGHGDVAIEAPSDKNNDKEAIIPSTPSNIDVPNSKNDSGQDWQISSIKTHDYTVSNGKDEFSLPIIENGALNIIKTNNQTLAFNYIKLNVPNDYVFTISKRRKMYQLSVLKQDNGKWQVVKTFKSRNYKDLMKELKKLVY